MNDIKQRLANLSPHQRQHLATQLQQYTSGEERLVAWLVGQSITGDDLRQYLRDQLPDYMVPTAFVLVDEFPRTPNGKIDRQALPEPQVGPQYDGSEIQTPRTTAEKQLTEIWADVLGFDRISINDNFFEIGGDSLISIQIVARAKQIGLKLSPNDVFDYPTIRELAGIAEALVETPNEPQPVADVAPLTPIQHWFIDQHLQQPAQWNQAFLLQSETVLDPEILQAALHAVVQHHPTLYTRFTNYDGEWQQTASPVPEIIPFEHHRLTSASWNEQLTQIETIATRFHQNLQLETGDLVRFAQFDTPQQSYVLLLVHHLIIDALSWQIVLEDLETAYLSRRQNKDITLPAEATSYLDWSQLLTDYAQSKALTDEKAYWLNSRFHLPDRLPRDLNQTVNMVADAATITAKLDATKTAALLHDVPEVYHTRINDVLLTALAMTLTHWTNKTTILLALEGHGRETSVGNVDISRTVGWFTSVFPIALTIKSSSNPGEVLLDIKEQLRTVPNNGIGHGLLQHLSHDSVLKERLAQMPEPEIVFNYLGRIGDRPNSLFKLESTAIGETRYPQDTRRYLIEINSLIKEDCLEATWTYSQAIHTRSTIESLAMQFFTNLESLINHCLTADAGGFSPSDFPTAFIDQGELDDLLADLED